MRRPGAGAHCPFGVLVFFVEGFRNSGQVGAVVRSRVTADALVVNGLGGVCRIRVFFGDLGVAAFGVGPVLFHEGDAGEAHLKIGFEFVFRQITLKAPAFLAFGIHDQNGRRPDGVEAFEITGILLDMDVKRDEVLVYERGDFRISVRFGLQPNTGSSVGGRAEIDEQGFFLFFSVIERLVGVCDPVYGHDDPSLNLGPDNLCSMNL